jgi:hypothetical protein
MKWPLQRKIGISLVVIGLGPFLAVEYYARLAHNWTPLNVPVLFTPGEYRSPEFRTDLDGMYLVSVALDPLSGRDLTREQCMMGAGSAWTCGDVKWTLQFEWQIVSDKGEIMVKGEYKPASISGAEMGITEFQGHRNSRQYMVLKVFRDAGELNSHHPRLVVEVPQSKELALAQYFSWLLAGSVGFLGFFLALWPISSAPVRKPQAT